jgi:chromate transporter
VLPSFAIVVAISAAYVHFGAMPWLGHVFYGVGAAVIAIMLRSAWRLTTRTMQRDVLLWMLFAINAIVTAITEAESVGLILGCGIAMLAVRRTIRLPRALFALAVPDEKLWKLAVYFAEAGTFVFGSGLAIVPFLHGGVVEQHRWLTERQFLDAVAVAMITPGPVVITVAFIGFLVAGFAGAVVAAVAVFLPCYLFVVLPAPFYERVANNTSLRAFIDGVTAAAIGAIAGAVIVLGRRAIIDKTSLAIGIVALLMLMWKRMPEPVVIAAAAVAGLALSA